MGGPWRAGAVALGLAVVAGCGARSLGAPRPVDLALALRSLHDLWDAHGGAAAWRRHTAVHFAYRASAEDGSAIELREVAFRLDDPRFLWIAGPGGEAPAPVKLAPGLRHGGSAALGFALGAARYLLCLPLASSAGRWEVRELLPPPGVEAPRALEVVPRDGLAPLGPCRLHGDPATGLLRRAYYLSEHPFARGGPVAVDFDDYAEVSGVRCARRRVHWRPEAPAPGTLDPLEAAFAPSGPSGGGRRVILREEVEDVRFLSREEADARYGVPEEEAGTP
ncbi:MAG: hypothetical protein HY721_19800 [Planctomycetes bacterium]|nr:hypothetical protein [Planctomycetota bacterium]